MCQQTLQILSILIFTYKEVIITPTLLLKKQRLRESNYIQGLTVSDLSPRLSGCEAHAFSIPPYCLHQVLDELLTIQEKTVHQARGPCHKSEKKFPVTLVRLIEIENSA